MAKHRAAANGGSKSQGGAAANRRSGQGAGSALKEMLRRQSQDPRPGTAPMGRDEPARPPPRKDDS